MPTARLLLLAAVLAALMAAPAGAQQADTGLFSVSPSSQTVVDRPPAQLDPVRVSNTTESALEVRVFPVILGQNVDGSFTFTENSRDLNAAAKILTPDTTEFVLAPGDVRSVRLRWNLLPSRARAAHMGVIFESRADATDNQQVKTVQRLLTVDFMRLPGPYRSSGEFTRLRATQGEKRTLVFFPRMRNTGEFVTKPTRGQFRIRNADSEIVFRTDWEGNVILPGAQREFPITMRKVLPAGDYAAVATADFGRSRGLKIIERFTLVGPNELPTGRIEITDFHGEGEIGGDSRVTGAIRSIGTAPATTAVRLDLYEMLPNGQQPPEPAQTKRLEFEDPIPPGESVPLEHVYPGLAAGNYRVIGTYRAEEGSVKEVVTDFAPQRERSAWQKFKDWLREHKGWVIGLSLLLLALLIAYFLRRQRRLQRELEAARAAAAAPSEAVAAPPEAAAAAAADTPPAPAPAPAAAPAGVDINSADLETLQSLPGVGPKAAERIIAHREEFGAFASLDELAQVEGFGAKRVENLRGLARV